MKRYFILLALTTIVGCSSANRDTKPQITVSIAPLAWIVEGLVDSSVVVNVLVPPGVSPETYEPSARQVEDLRRSEILFSIGLIDFEQQIEGRLRELASQTLLVRLADSLPLIHSSCGHDGHNHGGHDPHVWLSPKIVRQMTEHTAQILIEQKICDPLQVAHRRDSLISLIDSLDTQIKTCFTKSNNHKLAIVHPSLGYYANDYGLTQFAIEIDGKEPSGLTIKSLIDTLRANSINVIIYSEQNPATAAKVIANEIGGTIEKFDPVAKDWLENMKHITKIICKTN